MEYITRTTPAFLCHLALDTFDLAVRCAFEGVVGFGTSNSQWRQSVLAGRYSGLGMRSSTFHADAAYVASRAAVHDLCRAIWPRFTSSPADAIHGPAARINSKLHPDDQLILNGNFDEVPNQRTISDRLSKEDWEALRSTSQSYDVARLNTYSAPGTNRWLDDSPSRTLDKHLTSAEIISSVKLTLGVDVAERIFMPLLCRSG